MNAKTAAGKRPRMNDRNEFPDGWAEAQAKFDQLGALLQIALVEETGQWHAHEVGVTHVYRAVCVGKPVRFTDEMYGLPPTPMA